MACPGGCIGGGGQPKYRAPDILARRMAAIYTADESAAVRASHDNPAVQALYQKVLGQPGSRVAHELLHTSYSDRSGGQGEGEGDGRR
jgi:NADH-quinone oxidoreductase subunit G